MTRDFVVGRDDEGRRLDVVVRQILPGTGLSGLHKALRRGDIRVNGAKAGAEHRVHEADVITIWDRLLPEPSATVDLERPAVSLPSNWVLWESEHLLVVNKPSGILVHAGPSDLRQSTLDERVRQALASTLPSSLSFRPGPLHRLDKETSGIVVFSKSLAGAQTFSAALRERRIRKTYLTVLTGCLEGPVRETARLGRDETQRRSAVGDAGLEAVSVFRPLGTNGRQSLVEVTLETGRTHQIRAHAAHLGFPLWGDRKYGGPPARWPFDRPFFLHAWTLVGGGVPEVCAPLAEKESLWLEKEFKFPEKSAEHRM